jgi:hypothetical protein
MPNKIFVVLVLFLGLAITGCKTEQESILIEFEDFVVSAEGSYETFSESQWEASEAQYEQISLKADGLVGDMTEEQRKKLNNLKGRYAALQLKHLGKELGDGLKDFQQQVEGLLEVIGEDSLDEQQSGR